MRGARSSICIIPAINQDGSCKCCANCMTAVTPSWRRHPETQELLCNACGLYLRLHRKPRPITLSETGEIQVVRKNAAVHRDPINLPPAAAAAAASPHQYPSPYAFAAAAQSLRTTPTSLAALQDMATTPYPFADMAYSPPALDHHPQMSIAAPAPDYPGHRLFTDIMHMGMLDLPPPLPVSTTTEPHQIALRHFAPPRPDQSQPEHPQTTKPEEPFPIDRR